MIPADLLCDTVTWVQPVAGATDRYGNATLDYGVGVATRTTITGRLQQHQRVGLTAERLEGGDMVTSDWLFITNQAGIDAHDRIETASMTLEVAGRPAPLSTPQGVHHYEIRLRAVEG